MLLLLNSKEFPSKGDFHLKRSLLNSGQNSNRLLLHKRSILQSNPTSYVQSSSSHFLFLKICFWCLRIHFWVHEQLLIMNSHRLLSQYIACLQMHLRPWVKNFQENFEVSHFESKEICEFECCLSLYKGCTLQMNSWLKSHQ